MPTPICSPPAVARTTASPRSKTPVAEVTPAGSSERPCRVSARTAPSSSRRAPFWATPESSQRLRLSTWLRSAGTEVPGRSPRAMRTIASGRRPLAITASQPASAARRAASTLARMLPRPRKAATLSAASSAAASAAGKSVISAIRRAPGPRRGSRSKSPSTSLSRISRSASIRLAARAARPSFSPNAPPRSSSSATTSFSLMIGTTPNSSRRRRVLRTLR